MDIIKLPAGERARDDVDCVHIAKTDAGKYLINCSALLACGDGDEVESVALIGSDPYDSYEDAEAAGLAWAADQCVEQLYVTTS
jgi:hypothetical protein